MKMEPLNNSLTTKDKLLKQFEGLVSLGNEVRNLIPDHPFDIEDTSRLFEWRTRVLSLFTSVLPKGHPILKWASSLSLRYKTDHEFEELFGALNGVYEDFKLGMFEKIQMRVESEVSVDLLEQAERLLSDSDDRSHSFIPAAVLSGAVLEKNLRTLCDQHDPPIRTSRPNGQPKAMNALIDDLKKAEVIDEIWAKTLKAWADIRNAAAHGRIESVTPEQVKRMIEAIPDFLRQFMK